MSETDRFPIATDAFMTTLFRLLAGRGESNAVSILAAAEPTFEAVGYDRYDSQDVTFWQLTLTLDPSLYVLREKSEREKVQETIGDAARECLATQPGDGIQNVTVATRIVRSEDWRAEANAFVRGEGINNQGRVRSDSLPSQQRDGLLFRSQAEMRLYAALKATGVPFAPLPVFLRGGKEYRRIEPDFVVIRNRAVMVIEVDGDTIHHETPFEAHNRIKMLADEGVLVERVLASECATEDGARKCAERALAVLDKHAGRVVR